MDKEILKSEINVKNNKINVMRIGNKEYISLTDLARLQILKSQKSQFKPGCVIKMLLLI